MKRLFYFLLVSLAISVRAADYTIDSSRVPPAGTWVAAGVPGGIDQYYVGGANARTNLIDVTASPYNADKTGATACDTAINAAIAAAVDGDVVYFPAGAYKITEQIQFYKSITLRGAGPGQTVLRFYSGLFVLGISYAWSSAYPLTQNAAAGDTVFHVADTTGLNTNRLIKLWKDGDVSIPTMGVYAGLCTHAQTQLMRITELTPTTITVSPALIFAASTAAHSELHENTNGWAKLMGIEDMTWDNSYRTASSVCVEMVGCYWSWIRNVESYKSNGYHLMVVSCFQCEFRHNYIHESFSYGPNNSGIKMDSCSSCKIEDNIFYKCRPPIESNGFGDNDPNDYGGASGNVIAYNAAFNNYAASGQVGESFATSHSPYCWMDLYEGNYGTALTMDGYFGGTAYITAFRNWFRGTDPISEQTDNIACINLCKMARYYNIVGNLLGDPVATFTVHAPGTEIDEYVTKWIYRLGYPNVGNGNVTDGTATPSTGNWWIDWNPTDGWDYHGTLTTRTNDTSGVITTSGTVPTGMRTSINGGTFRVHWNSNANVSGIGSITNITGTDPLLLTFTVGSGVLPDQNTAVTMSFGSYGFQQFDGDVETTALLVGNYNSQDAAIPVAETLSGQTLANSLVYTSKPTWFGGLAWPAFDPLNPVWDYTRIPAGYRYTYGVDPPSTAELAPATRAPIPGGAVGLLFP